MRSMPFGELEDFIQVMYEQKFEDGLWEMYLHNPFREGSFEDFKNEAIQEAKEKAGWKDNRSKEIVETEAVSAEREALNLLNSLGGDVLGG